MPSQEEFAENGLELPIVIKAAEDGHGKTRNVPANQEQRDVATSREDSYFSTYVRLATCVHGTWSQTDKTPTSFIVLECEFHCLQSDERLKSVKLEWKFLNTEKDKMGSPSNPNIVARGPHIFRSWNSSSAHMEDESNFGANLGGGGAGVTAGINASLKHNEKHDQPYFEKVESSRRFNDKEQRHDSVWWRYSQNERQKLGVTPGCRIAVLLKRKNDVPFDGMFEIAEFDGGWKYSGSQVWNKIRGKSENEDDPIHFNPKLPAIGSGTEIVENNLGCLATDEGIDKKYAWIWGIDVGK
jgi:hypothetical protein